MTVFWGKLKGPLYTFMATDLYSQTSSTISTIYEMQFILSLRVLILVKKTLDDKMLTVAPKEGIQDVSP